MITIEDKVERIEKKLDHTIEEMHNLNKNLSDLNLNLHQNIESTKGTHNLMNQVMSEVKKDITNTNVVFGEKYDDIKYRIAELEKISLKNTKFRESIQSILSVITWFGSGGALVLGGIWVILKMFSENGGAFF